MMSTFKFFHTASPVAQDKKGCVVELGRGSTSKSSLQSPASSLSSGVADVNVPLWISHRTWSDNAAQRADPGMVLTSNAGPAFSSGAGSGQQLMKAGPSGVKVLTKCQKRNLRKRKKRKTLAASGGSGAVFKRPWPVDSIPSLTMQALNKKQKKDVQPWKGIQSGQGQPKKYDPLQGTVQPGLGTQLEEDIQLEKSICPTSYAHAVESIRMAIVKEDFPSGWLSLADSDKIQRQILVEIDSIPIGYKLPILLGNFLQKGALILQCGNAATVDWIRFNFSENSEVLDGITLKVLSIDKVSKPIKVAFKTKDKFSSPDMLLRRLQRFNPRLKSTEWRVLQFLPSETEGLNSVLWIFGVDSEDVEEIQRADYGALTGLDRGVFKILYDPNRKVHHEECDHDIY